MYQSVEVDEANLTDLGTEIPSESRVKGISNFTRVTGLLALVSTVVVVALYGSEPRKSNDSVAAKFEAIPRTSSAKYARKEIRQFSKEELEAYFDAVWAMKETGRQDGRGYLVYYDDFVAQHALAASNVTMDQAHLYAAFTVWHSLLTYEFELALRSINPNVSIPYWDWTIDEATDEPLETEILTDKYFGKANKSNDYIVDNGYVAYFPVSTDYSEYVWWTPMSGYLRSADNDNSAPYITRYVGEQEKKLPSTAEWDTCLVLQNYSQFWICMWGAYGSYGDASLLHGGVHEFAGGVWNTTRGTAVGDFFDSNTSPNDPIWWSHHANLDRLWWEWKVETGDALATKDDYCGGYYGGQTVDPQPVGHNLWNVFAPPFYAFRTIEEISTLGGLSINEACYYFMAERMPYTYE